VKRNVSSLAVFGGEPVFTKPFPVGQNNLVAWERFETAFRGIFSRRYYTNHGPLLQELETRLSAFFGVRNVVCMTNATISLMIAAKALGLQGKVVVPALTFPATVQSLMWAGLEPVFCDIDRGLHLITPALAEPLLDNTISAILGVHLWGNGCDPEGFEKLARERGLRLYFDAAHAFGCVHNGNRLGRFGDMEIFSFNADNIVNAAEGGCVCTDDDGLAEVLRNMRSSYGIRKQVPIPLTGNGRMSEAQAALALMSLEDYPLNSALNKERFDRYMSLLASLPGIRFILPAPGDKSNYQNALVEIDADEFGLSRDKLVRVMAAENALGRHSLALGLHRCQPFRTRFPQYFDALPSTDMVCSIVMPLPCGQQVTLDDISSICSLLGSIHENAAPIRDRFGGVQ
jgi:dTDP-4-amino-4,6-dideoxygalactose transaminase